MAKQGFIERYTVPACDPWKTQTQFLHKMWGFPVIPSKHSYIYIPVEVPVEDRAEWPNVGGDSSLDNYTKALMVFRLVVRNLTTGEPGKGCDEWVKLETLTTAIVRWCRNNHKSVGLTTRMVHLIMSPRFLTSELGWHYSTAKRAVRLK